MNPLHPPSDPLGAAGQISLGIHHPKTQGATHDVLEMADRYRKEAKQLDAEAQVNLGVCDSKGVGMLLD